MFSPSLRQPAGAPADSDERWTSCWVAAMCWDHAWAVTISDTLVDSAALPALRRALFTRSTAWFSSVVVQAPSSRAAARATPASWIFRRRLGRPPNRRAGVRCPVTMPVRTVGAVSSRVAVELAGREGMVGFSACGVGGL